MKNKIIYLSITILMILFHTNFSYAFMLAFNDKNEKINIYNSSTKEIIKTNLVSYDFDISPDGNKIAYISVNNDIRSLYIYHISTHDSFQIDMPYHKND